MLLIPEAVSEHQEKTRESNAMHKWPGNGCSVCGSVWKYGYKRKQKPLKICQYDLFVSFLKPFLILA